MNYFSNVNSDINLENSSTYSRSSLDRNIQVKKEPGFENNNDYSRVEYVPKETSNLTSALIDFEEFCQKADCDFRNFFSATDKDLGYNALKSKHPELIKDLESNIFFHL